MTHDVTTITIVVCTAVATIVAVLTGLNSPANAPDTLTGDLALAVWAGSALGSLHLNGGLALAAGSLTCALGLLLFIFRSTGGGLAGMMPLSTRPGPQEPPLDGWLWACLPPTSPRPMTPALGT